MTIRRGRVADAETISPLYAAEARLQEALGGYALVTGYDWTSWVAALLADPDQRFFVAERGNSVVGYIHVRSRFLRQRVKAPGVRGWLQKAVRALRRRSQPNVAGAAPARLDGWGIIQSLYVLETERLLGIGSRLLEAAKVDLFSIGVTRIEISVMAVNEAAMAFWSSRGFRPFRVHLSARIRDENERGPTGSTDLPRRR